MKTIEGTYHKGKLKLNKELKSEKPLKVLLTVKSSSQKSPLKYSAFSFEESQELLKDCDSSFADDVIEERRGKCKGVL